MYVICAFTIDARSLGVYPVQPKPWSCISPSDSVKTPWVVFQLTRAAWCLFVSGQILCTGSDAFGTWSWPTTNTPGWLGDEFTRLQLLTA